MVYKASYDYSAEDLQRFLKKNEEKMKIQHFSWLKGLQNQKFSCRAACVITAAG
jgi:hypothetical protein